ncbi:T9SS type A sorting domain-containing protein [Winogradskyella tangerina]|uniref:T9SS type A sorting domain-containing protein n=1 Tax=Winogradskyella tangerina TaxID=2023240 RepID=UPI000DBE2B59|nr:T9SS type A sorting domain-containing protein [Winogradskyella tangerina]
MKISLIACLMLCFSSASAQLSVRNNAYVFVNDQILFVEDDVNLEESTAKIYLRSEAQLIQGTGTTGNSGIGELSVYQQGNTNQWEYNYWCSPVGGILSDTNVNNAFRINQLDDPLLGTADLIDSNDSFFTTNYNGNDSPLTISDRWLWSFVSSSQYSQWLYLGDSGDIAPGLGFTMKGSGTTANFGDTNYDFRGKPNSGNITSPVAAGQFTLVGNPYPSALDARDFLYDTDNLAAITGTLFYWDHDTSTPQRQTHVLQEYVGGYHEFTINSDGSLPTLAPAVFMTYTEDDQEFPLPGPGESGTRTARRYIPIGQGFMVEGRVGTTGTVTAKNSHRDYVKLGASSSFFRNSEGQNDNYDGFVYQDNGLVVVPSDYKRFRINVDFTVSENQYTRQMILNFHDTATMGFDYGLELSRSSNYESDAYFTIDDKAYSAQAYPFSDTLIIPLVLDIEEQQPLRFRIFDIQNFEDSQNIYIHDIQDNIYVNLRDQDYELNIDAGHYPDRFEIVFTADNVLDIEDIEFSDLTIRQNNNDQQLNVINPNGLDIKSIEVYDVAGKRMLNGLYDTVQNRYELSTSNLSEGVYIVNVKSNSNAVTSEKIIVKH